MMVRETDNIKTFLRSSSNLILVPNLSIYLSNYLSILLTSTSSRWSIELVLALVRLVEGVHCIVCPQKGTNKIKLFIRLDNCILSVFFRYFFQLLWSLLEDFSIFFLVFFVLSLVYFTLYNFMEPLIICNFVVL